jgi:hypothetical protein
MNGNRCTFDRHVDLLSSIPYEPDSIKDDIAWLESNSRSYVPPTDKSFDKNKKEAMKVQKALGRVS